jgi:hypothetical protein
MNDEEPTDRPAAPAVPPSVVLREGWAWARGVFGWRAIDGRGESYATFNEDGTITTRDDPPADVILAVLEANVSPALEERDRRVRADLEHENSAMRRMFLLPHARNAEVITSMEMLKSVSQALYDHGADPDEQEGESILDGVLLLVDQRNELGVEADELRAERDKLRADLSAALAERDEARRQWVLHEVDSLIGARVVEDVEMAHLMRVQAESMFGDSAAARLFPAPADPEGGPTE